VYRRAIYTHLSVPDRVEFWRTHLAPFAARQDLSSSQRGFLELVMSRLPMYLNGEAGRQAIKRDGLQDMATKLFGRPVAFTIFSTLGPNTGNGKPSAARDSDCNCNTEFGFCMIGICRASSECNYVFQGCGILGQADCNGECPS